MKGNEKNKKIFFERSGFALIVFEDSDGFDNAINNLNDMTCFGKSENKFQQNGLKGLLSEWISYHLKDPAELKNVADKVLADYDNRVKRQNFLKEKLTTTEDNDGWTMVLKREHKKSKDTSGTVVAPSKLSQKQLQLIKAEQDNRIQFKNLYPKKNNEMKKKKLNEKRKMRKF